MEQLKVTGKADTIVAIATPVGVGGIAVIRISGPDAIAIVGSAWKGKSLLEAPSHTLHYGKYVATDGNQLDDAVAAIFRSPTSYTGENVVELSLHGSKWIQREVLADLIRRGARTAGHGEFTQRAFLNGKIDLAQAEGIADLISSSSRAAHRLALSQTRGTFSKELDRLREKLVEFASLLELELDFSEEDVEFADRNDLLDLANLILGKVNSLARSYSSGAVIKEGIPVVIAGIPNAGKSSLLNLLLGDDKAIVSNIPGTTRDTIEDTIELDGILYRFIDTAGLRTTDDIVENLGIDRAKSKMQIARIIIWIIDLTTALPDQLTELSNFRNDNPDIPIIILLNKSDLLSEEEKSRVPQLELSQIISNYKSSGTSIHRRCKATDCEQIENERKEIYSHTDKTYSPILFSTKNKEGIETLLHYLKTLTIGDIDTENEIIVTNARHYESLIRGAESLQRAIEAIENGISADFIAQDVRETLHHLGAITGTVTTDTLLHSIFSRFCIGK